MSFGTDLLICILPKQSPEAPTAGPPILKAHLQAHGFTCKVEDLNIELYDAFKRRDQHLRYWYQDDSIWVGDSSENTEDFIALMKQYHATIDQWISRWKRLRPKRIGFSMLSHFARQMAIYLSERVRQRLPGTEIIWGGAYIGPWVKWHARQNTIDHFVYGDAEESLVSLMKGQIHIPGVDNFKNNQFDLEKMMMPDYSDIRWDLYDDDDRDTIYVTGSRGCVKNCTFCNVADIWPKYKFRSGEHIAREIIHLREQYQRRTFHFTDSLINGSMTAFRDMMQTLAAYRRLGAQDWHWTSQYIIRSPSQSPESDFAMMRDSGCNWLDIGVESFSESVRWHMGKKFTDNDLWFSLEMMSKHGIGGSLLTFVGYPTETEEDHQCNLHGIRKLHELGYLNNERGVQIRPTFGNLCFFDDSMPLWNQLKDDVRDWKGPLDWTYRDNTLEVRLRRYEEIHQLLDEVYAFDGDRTRIRNRKNYRMKAEGKIPEGDWNH